MSDKKASQSVLAATRQELIDQLVAGYQRPARWCRRRIDPSCRKTLPHPNTPQTLAQCGIERAAAGSVKIGTLGQEHVSANNYLADSIAGRVNVNCGPRRRAVPQKNKPRRRGVYAPHAEGDYAGAWRSRRRTAPSPSKPRASRLSEAGSGIVDKIIMHFLSDGGMDWGTLSERCHIKSNKSAAYTNYSVEVPAPSCSMRQTTTATHKLQHRRALQTIKVPNAAWINNPRCFSRLIRVG